MLGFRLRLPELPAEAPQSSFFWEEVGVRIYNLQGLLQSPEGSRRILVVFSPKIWVSVAPLGGEELAVQFWETAAALGLSRVEVWALGTLELSCSFEALWGFEKEWGLVLLGCRIYKGSVCIWVSFRLCCRDV